MIVAFFDFDGTITKKDTLIDFAIYCKGRGVLIKILLINLHWVVGYKLQWISGHKIKEIFLTQLFKGISKTELKRKGQAYCENKLPNILSKKALDKIKWHQEQKHKVIVVTASSYSWVQPFCDVLKVDLIATNLMFEKEKFTGKLQGKNCIGVEKVNRIIHYLKDDKITYSYGYGNSKGDNEMLAFSDEKYYNFF